MIWERTLFRWGRVVSTGWSFAVFMVWGALLGFVFHPLVSIVASDKRHARETFMRYMQRSWRFFIRMMESTKAFERIEVRDIHFLRQNRASLIVANHVTLVDIVAIGGQVDNFNCIVKTSLLRHPFFGKVVRACDFIPGVGGEDFIKLCEKGFSQDRPLVVFPQGSRISPNEPVRFQRGAAQIAVRLGIPIIPVTITCKPPTLQKEVPWYVVPNRASTLSVKFGKPLDIPEEIMKQENTPLKVRALNSYLEDYFTKALGKGQA